MPYLMRLCVPHESEFHNTGRHFVGDINDTTWSSSLEILNVFSFLLFLDFPSIPNLAALNHLCGTCICNANCTYCHYESVGRKNWDVQLYFHRYIMSHGRRSCCWCLGIFALCGNTNPIIFVNREDVFGRRLIRHPNFNVLCNNPKFSMNHYHWVNSRIWGIHNS